MIKYGVLISNLVTGELLAVLELDPSGMLITSSFTEKIPPISLPYFVKSYLDQPIYKKLTDVLARDEALSPKLMKTETQHLAEIINGKSRTLGGVRIVASSAQCG